MSGPTAIVCQTQQAETGIIKGKEKRKVRKRRKDEREREETRDDGGWKRDGRRREMKERREREEERKRRERVEAFSGWALLVAIFPWVSHLLVQHHKDKAKKLFHRCCFDPGLSRVLSSL